ncbi:uncharacterized protein P174DRAFT_432817 [Aspergillus novofumigatus IBT 16806]|uniref:BTB domain-containing protein n=1 Tax=Aspergillus novofumigatus (strain IBT 16806) TaxID=1392255 RepID=A0A2I1C180_ASPN1|nr:uncharacterized protein P174DRAFT_432817 [Aspergillus novofumigatus IBT 16806]PKX91355.1 hypothetical protein P174DRAFT_432817 [Aspergillus novofumigatus IBT 16806]
MYRLNQDGKFFDFTFTVQGEQFHVSKLVLSTISLYFANKFEAEWKYKDRSNASQSGASVDLKQKHSVETFSTMIEYIYTYNYEQQTGWLFDFEPSELVAFHFELCHMAKDYEIPDLSGQVLMDLPSAVKTLDCPVDLYDLLTDGQYISDSESGKLFVATVADNFHNMDAFTELDRLKPFLVKTPIFAADLIYELMERRLMNGQ